MKFLKKFYLSSKKNEWMNECLDEWENGKIINSKIKNAKKKLEKKQRF